MKDEAAELGQTLEEKFGEKVTVKFIDITSDEFADYPEIKEILDRVRLPLTVINGSPRLRGGIAPDMIIDAVEGLL